MARTLTTSTFEFRLTKYSKSYPQNGQTDNWQHFSNPVIKLVLDLRRSSNSELESARVRIIWTIDADDHLQSSQASQQRDVIFEDLELLSFSSLFPLKAQKNLNAQGLPLKAVFRDTVVGIRYIHITSGNDYTSNPIYRRFQIIFESIESASQFIELINTVCPCKANPAPEPAAIQIHRPIGMAAPATPSRPQLQRFQSTRPSASPETPLRQQPSFWLDAPNSSPHLSFSSPVQPSNLRFLAQPSQRQHTTSDPDPSQNSSSQSSVPSKLSQPTEKATTSHDGDIEMNISSETPSTPRFDIVAALKEATSLYDMPQAELEKVVGDIVREDGFVKLLENMDTLWNIKGYLGS